jgi:hypothetical protein
MKSIYINVIKNSHENRMELILWPLYFGPLCFTSNNPVLRGSIPTPMKASVSQIRCSTYRVMEVDYD